MCGRKASLQTLPDELLEAVLVFCAENGHAESVAAVAATSQRLYSTIYKTTDHHLWRTLFLTLFDDPRTLRYYASSNFGENTRYLVWQCDLITEVPSLIGIVQIGEGCYRTASGLLPSYRDICLPLSA